METILGVIQLKTMEMIILWVYGSTLSFIQTLQNETSSVSLSGYEEKRLTKTCYKILKEK